MFNFPLEIRRVIYTTNAIESMNMTLRKVTRNHRLFPTDEAVLKVVFLATANIAKRSGDAHQGLATRLEPFRDRV